jgi:hypothetical protein
MVMMTLYVQDYENEAIIEAIEIDSEETFGTFRKKAANALGKNHVDLLLVAGCEYNGSYNSKKIGEIDGITKEMTFYAVFLVGGGNNPNLNINYIN